MKRLIIIAVVIVSALNVAQAQSNIRTDDMLRISQQYPWGTARAMGMGGAFGALGGDMTSLSLNPAGIGIYRKSEFTFTPSINYNNTLSTMPDSVSTTMRPYSSSDFAQRLRMSNIGYVFTINTDKEEGWVSASFGIAYNRLSDFDRNIVMKTPSANSSLLDEFTYYANDKGQGALSPSDMYSFYEKLGYETYAIDNNIKAGWWNSDYTNNHAYGESQTRKREIRGGVGEYALSMGANYSNRFYLGMTIGIQDLYYKETATHTEVDVNGNIPNLKSFDFTEHYRISGSGVNFKLGMQYKPIDMLRLGVAVHSPTFYNTESEFYTSMNAYFDSNIANGQSYSGGESDATRVNNNTFATPWKFIGSAALQLQQFGFLSVDYERLNYSKMRLHGDIDPNSDPNDELDGTLTSVNNLRVGAEIKLGPLALRGGLGFYQTPYKHAPLNKIDYQTYTAGVGYRGESFFFDLAYVHLNYSDRYQLYSVVERGGTTDQYWVKSPTIASSDYKLNQFVATIGFRF